MMPLSTASCTIWALHSPAPAPDRLEQIDAQVTYTAMMTGTLMDGGGAHG